MIREHDCGTMYSETINREEKQTLFGDSFENRLYGKFTATDILDPT